MSRRHANWVTEECGCVWDSAAKAWVVDCARHAAATYHVRAALDRLKPIEVITHRCNGVLIPGGSE